MSAKHAHKELLDLVDQQGTVIGTESRDVVYARKMKNFRLVEVVVKNSSGNLFIMKRDKENPMMRGLWETLGEHPHAGEKDLDAARRGVAEELGIDVPSLQFQFLGYTTPYEGTVGYCAVFMAQIDKDPVLNEEHTEGCWMTPTEVMGMFKQDPRQFRSNVRVIFGKFSKEIFAP